MSLAPRIGLLLATLALLALLGEGAVRVIEADRRGVGLFETAGVPEITDLKELGQPMVSGILAGVPYRANSRGIRGPDYTPRPDPGTFRILIAGDSITMGWGVAEDKTYAQLLERLLEEAGPEHPASDPALGIERFEVINLGVAGVSAAYANQSLARFSKIYRPHMTIYGFTLNDIEGPRYRRSSPREPDGGVRATWLRALRFRDSPSHLLRELWPRFVLLLDRDTREPAEDADPASSNLHQNYFENSGAWADFEAALDQHAAVVAAGSHCGHVLIHTFLTRLDVDHPHRRVYARVADAARERGLSVTQSLPNFLGRDAKALWLSRFDSHPNRRGHAVLAQALFEGLGALRPECWQPRSRLER